MVLIIEDQGLLLYTSPEPDVKSKEVILNQV
jgi:hypothetical protein